jgi:uncharacterized protein (DUF433 family)
MARRIAVEVHAAERAASAASAQADVVAEAQFDKITVDPQRLGGKPCIRGLRIPVGMIVRMVAAGKTVAEIISEYPYLEAEDVRQALAYSAALAGNEYHLALRSSA